eukprot:9496713-Pyramimonas_sp.AAC.1
MSPLPPTVGAARCIARFVEVSALSPFPASRMDCAGAPPEGHAPRRRGERCSHAFSRGLPPKSGTAFPAPA